jgi:DNA repair protein RecO (recombination protein O)
MALYREYGVVLRTWKLGEADRILNICTRGHGKVRAVAKGVRKTKSKFGGRLEPTGHVALQLYEGRNLDIVTQVETIDRFVAFHEDLDRYTTASAMLEVTDQVLQEDQPSQETYHLLVGALRALAGPGGELVLPGFFLKLLALEGYRPELDSCVNCGSETALVAFSPLDGGTLCRTCRRGTSVSPEALALMRQILGGQLGAALSQPASPATGEVRALATDLVEHYLERRLRSIGVIDQT